MAKIQYTSYDFNIPSELEESDYKTIKELLNDNGQLKITPYSSFIETFKRELIMLGIGVLCGYIASFDIAEWINWVFGIPAIMAGYIFLFSFAPSFITYIDFMFDKRRYYSKLKKNILKSNSYIDFINIREKKRWSQF
ncbi:MAG: hypothetical protein ACI87N_000108 [Flavobacteriales bacterium]|jgi:hypothetical protein